MVYCQIKKDVAGRYRSDGYRFIADELYTRGEAARLQIQADYFTVIEVSIFRTYWYHFARFYR